MMYLEMKQHRRFAVAVALGFGLLWVQQVLLPETWRYAGIVIILCGVALGYFAWTKPSRPWRLAMAGMAQLAVIIPTLILLEHGLLLRDLDQAAAWPKILFISGTTVGAFWLAAAVCQAIQATKRGEPSPNPRPR